MILQPMTDFVLEQNKNYKNSTRCIRIKESELYVNYAKFLKQPLTLEMFVPCDEEGNVLQEPKPKYFDSPQFYESELQIYHEAKEKVLFADVKIKHRENYFILEDEDGTWLRVINKNTSLTVEDLLKMSTISLTESALKQIGIC